MSNTQVVRPFNIPPLEDLSTKGDFKKVEFTLTELHLFLLSRMSVEYRDDVEFGAPAIDPKRPYLSSDPYKDINEILGLGFVEDKDGYFSKEARREMDELHRETETALQIVLHTAKFEPGVYQGLELVPGKYDRYWKKVRDLDDPFDIDPVDRYLEEKYERKFWQKSRRIQTE